MLEYMIVRIGAYLGLFVLVMVFSFFFHLRRDRAQSQGIYPLGKGSINDIQRLVTQGEVGLAISLYRRLYNTDLVTAKCEVQKLCDLSSQPRSTIPAKPGVPSTDEPQEPGTIAVANPTEESKPNETPLQLSGTSSPGGGGDDSRMQSALTADQLTSIQGLIRAGKKIEAVKFLRAVAKLELTEAKAEIERISNKI